MDFTDRVNPSNHHYPPSLFFFLITFLCFLFSVSLSDPRTTEAALHCGTDRPPPSFAANFIPTFVKEMETLSQIISTHHFATHHINFSSAPLMYGLAQCHHDLSQTECLLCYAVSRTKIPQCLPSSALIFLDGCFLRYANYSFYNESVNTQLDSVTCSSQETEIFSESERVEFVRNVEFAVGNVTRIATRDGGFGVVSLEGVYALAQCWESVAGDGCRECLEKAAKGARGCAPKREGRGLNAGCYLRYSTRKFYNDDGETGGDSEKGVLVAIALAMAAFFMLSLFAAYAAYSRMSKMKKERDSLGKVSSNLSKSSLTFKYETLEKATDYFSVSRKIGQGGSGSVYLGILPNGKTIAVKRLVFNTRQWVSEFFNEVNLISGIQHKNLVKLLGCSIEGPESLLVYEYVPNKSLDHFVFGEKKPQILNWEQRFNIILGTAEGLAYLHGGTQIRIIHRDIKSSNVLLDEKLNPKIADFGLARCFAADKSHISTGIAGTLGYMAPEYVVRGQLTDKADVYSFGVLVLEIVCGRRNNSFIQDSDSLLLTAWKLYNANGLAEAADPCLGNNFQAEEVSNVLQIGLLCTQASVPLRPSMAHVVWMLTNKDCEIPNPNQPPYLTSNMMEPTGSVKSYSTSSFMSNAATRKAASCTSSGSESSSRHISDGQ